MKISNLKIYTKIKSAFKNNVILRVFTKEYCDETLYYETVKDNIMKLKSDNYDVDERIKVLKKNNYKSNFKVVNINEN